eukprot:15342299-Ditylum_brightwellii.AAC.1
MTLTVYLTRQHKIQQIKRLEESYSIGKYNLVLYTKETDHINQVIYDILQQIYKSRSIDKTYIFPGFPIPHKVQKTNAVIGSYAEVLKAYAEASNPQEESIGYLRNIGPTRARKQQAVELSKENFLAMITQLDERNSNAKEENKNQKTKGKQDVSKQKQKEMSEKWKL